MIDGKPVREDWPQLLSQIELDSLGVRDPLAVSRLLGYLLDIWNGWDSSRYYVQELLPELMESKGQSSNLIAEREIFRQLSVKLSTDEWARLPELLEMTFDLLREARKRFEQAGRVRSRQDRQRQNSGKSFVEGETSPDETRDSHEDSLISDLDHETEDSVAQDPNPSSKVDTNDGQDSRILEVRAWMDRTGVMPLSSEQVDAIADYQSDLLVRARAGSGKTRLLVSRCRFLIEDRAVAPEKILLLAFNTDAAEEMRQRLAPVDKNARPHVRTFHSLANSIVRPEAQLIFDSSSSGNQSVSRLIADICDELLDDEPTYEQVKKIMLAYFRSDWNMVTDIGGFGPSKGDQITQHLASRYETFKGDFVKSYGESVIANCLFANSINYIYERSVRLENFNYRPDFIIERNHGPSLIIEYFGVRGDPEYERQRIQKRELIASLPNWDLLELTPADVGGDRRSAETRLLAKLDRYELKPLRLSDNQLWEKVRTRAVDRMAQSLANFVNRARKSTESADLFHQKLMNYRAKSPIESEFLAVAAKVLWQFESRLTRGGKIDFDQIVWRAAKVIREGVTRFFGTASERGGDLQSIEYVLIDEFQDFSLQFKAVIDAIREIQPRVNLFCVGDDWQAINGFAGSDTRFFTNFRDLFPGSKCRDLRSNYRSGSAIVELSNRLMSGMGEAAISSRNDFGNVFTVDRADFNCSPLEKVSFRDGDSSPLLLRIIQRALQRGGSVALLSRNNEIPRGFRAGEGSPPGLDGHSKLLRHLQVAIPTDLWDQVQISTIHSFKGREADSVVILDAVTSFYPYRHHTWPLFQFFYDSQEGVDEEERRLLYVGITRAKRDLYLLTHSKEGIGVHLNQLIREFRPVALNQHELRPAWEENRLIVHVRGGYKAKESLRNSGFRFFDEDSSWRKVVTDRPDLERVIRSSEWFQGGIEVRVTDFESNVRFRFRVTQ